MSENTELEELKETVKDLSTKVAHLDKSFVAVNINLKDYVNWVKQLEKTLRNLDDSMKEISNSHQRIPFERINDFQKWVSPIGVKIDLLEKTKVSRRDLYVLIAAIVLFIGSFSTLLTVAGAYVIADLKEDIINSVSANKDLIEKNANYISIHDRSRVEILRKLHTHKNKVL